MELTVFARFHAREGTAHDVATLMRNQLAPVRAEPGCLSIDAFRSTCDPQLPFPFALG